MIKKCFSIVFLLILFVSNSNFAKEWDFCSFEKVEDNRVYLKPGAVQVAKNGIFINVRNHLVPVDHLKMDEEGVYFELNTHAGMGGRCPLCGFPLIFIFCLNPDCPSKG